MKKIRILSLILCLAIILGCFTACGSSPKKGIVGDWTAQGEKGTSISFDKDGSFSWYAEHGDGVYTIASDKTLVIDVPDEKTTDELTWDKNFDPDNPASDIWYVDGDFLVFFGEFFTRTGKDQEKILKKHLKVGSSKDDKGDKDNDISSAGGTATKVLDAFDGVNLTVTGISPFCEVSLDTSSCPSEVQDNVHYESDKKYYSNGDSVVITASLSSWGGEGYEIKTKTKTFKVSGMPEYITSTEGINLDSLIKERDDYVKAKTAESARSDTVFGRYYYKPLSNAGDVVCEYLVSMKQNKLSQADPESYGFTYNKICFLYHITVVTDKGSGERKNCYANVWATNIVKYPDGTIKWGFESADALDFQAETSDKSIEDITATSITSMNSDYDIKKITL